MCISKHNSNIVQVISSSLSAWELVHQPEYIRACVYVRQGLLYVVAVMDYWVRLAPFQSVLQLLSQKKQTNNKMKRKTFLGFFPSSARIQMSDQCGETFKGNTCGLGITSQLNSDTVTWMSAWWSVSKFLWPKNPWNRSKKGFACTPPPLFSL